LQTTLREVLRKPAFQICLCRPQAGRLAAVEVGRLAAAEESRLAADKGPTPTPPGRGLAYGFGEGHGDIWQCGAGRIAAVC